MKKSSNCIYVSGLSKSLIFVFIFSILFLSGCNREGKTSTIKVLCVSDVPETVAANYYQTAAAYIFAMDFFITPGNFLSDSFEVTGVGWFEAADQFDMLDQYRAIILWDCPSHITDDRNAGPLYSNLEVISEKGGKNIVEFVKNGGALIVAGGVTSYGNNAPRLGATQHIGKRQYFGYSKNPIAEVLPVIIEPKTTTLVALDEKGKAKPSFIKLKRPAADETKDALLEGLDFQNWGTNAYHKLKPKENADVLLKLDNNDPLIVLGSYGQGRVACVTLSPRGNSLVRDNVAQLKNPLWPGEAVLWERLMRWATDMESDRGAEKYAADRYSRLVSNPVSTPLSEIEGQFPYVAHVLNQCLPANFRQPWMKFFNISGFNRLIIQSAPNTESSYYQSLQQDLSSSNLTAFMHADLSVEPRTNKIPPEKWAQVTQPSGEFALHYGDPYPCPYSDIVLKYASKEAREIMLAVGERQNINGCVYDDEWAWVMGYRNPYQGDQGLGSYSPWVNQMYKQKTGSEAPMPAYREPGFVAREDDPWLKWCIEVRQDAYYNYNENMKNVFKSYRDDFVLCNYPGGFEGNLDIMIEEVYLDCWKESELEAVERMDIRPNFREDKYRDKNDMWPLIGIFRMPEDKSMYPESMRLTAGLCLGTGAKGLIIWNSANLWASNLQVYGREPLYKEAARLGEFLKKHGSIFIELKKVPADIWVLSGWFWVNSFDNYYHVPPQGELEDKEKPWWMFQVSDVAVPAILRAGLYAEFVTEKQLMSDDLFSKKAVIVPGALYCRQGVVDNLNKYAKQKGSLFKDKSCAIDFKNAKVLDVDFSKWHQDISAGKRPIIKPTEETYRKHRAMREAYVTRAIPEIRSEITNLVRPNIVIENDMACYTLMSNGDTTYLFVYNCDVDNKNTIDIGVGDEFKYAYDIKASGRIDLTKTGGNLQFNFEPGGWKILAMTNQIIKTVIIESCHVADNIVSCRSLIEDSSGNIFSGAVSVRIDLTDDSGKVYSVYRASANGIIDTRIEIPNWFGQPRSIAVTELFSNNKTIQTGI